MSSKLAAKLLATALILSPISAAVTALPVAAQSNNSISFGYFHDRLAPYGQWYHHARWGDVWRPRNVEADFRPYQRGHWDYTDRFGWVWAADYEWGDIAFHYGRWVYDPYDGWLWAPGYVWAPAWVVWRSGGGYIGWSPMPPDDRFLAGDETYRSDWNNWDRGYGYADWYGPSYGRDWLLSVSVFVDERHFADRDFNRYIAPRTQIVNIANNTTNVTNYVTVNNYITNRSVDVTRIEKAAGRRVERVAERDIVKTNTPIVTVDAGRQIQVQERRQHGGDATASPRARVAALPDPAKTGQNPRPDAGNREQNRVQGNAPGNQPGNRNDNNGPRGQANTPQGQGTDRAVRENNGGAGADQRNRPNAEPSNPQAQGNDRGGNNGERNGAAEQQRNRANAETNKAPPQANVPAEQERVRNEERARTEQARQGQEQAQKAQQAQQQQARERERAAQQAAKQREDEKAQREKENRDQRKSEAPAPRPQQGATNEAAPPAAAAPEPNRRQQELAARREQNAGPPQAQRQVGTPPNATAPEKAAPSEADKARGQDNERDRNAGERRRNPNN